MKNNRADLMLIKKGSRTPLREALRFQMLLKDIIPGSFSLGDALGEGDCFFDATAQALNERGGNHRYDAKFLRNLCVQFYQQNEENRALVDQWCQEDSRGIDSNLPYELVQYMAEDYTTDLKGVMSGNPIWGRPNIEGRILCRALPLSEMYILEILDSIPGHPAIIAVQRIDAARSVSVSPDEIQSILAEKAAPFLVITQSSQHFVPLLFRTVEMQSRLPVESIILEKPAPTPAWVVEMPAWLSTVFDQGPDQAVLFLTPLLGLLANFRSDKGDPISILVCAHAITNGFTNTHRAILTFLVAQGISLDLETSNGKSTALMLASFYGHQELVEFLIENKASCTKKNARDKTALSFACGNGHLNVAMYLLENTLAEECLADECVEAGLIVAAQRGHREVLSYLIDQARQTQLFLRRRSLIDILNRATNLAFENGRQQTVKDLLNYGATINVNKIPLPQILNSFLIAAKQDSTSIVKQLIEECGIHINAVCGRPGTVLMAVAADANLQMADFLLDLGADVNFTDSTGNTPLMCAAAYGHLDMVKLLLERGADINQRNHQNYTAVMVAYQKGYEKLAHFLIIECGADMESRISGGSSILHFAVLYKHHDVIEKLMLTNKSYIDHVDDAGNTALMLAIKHQDSAAVDLLLGHEANIHIGNASGQTALSFAVLNQNLSLVTRLISLGANVNVGNCEWSNPLMCAAVNGDMGITQYLLQVNQLQINAKDERGCTALIRAIRNMHPEIALLLIAHNADITVRTQQGEGVLRLAAQCAHSVTLLQKLVELGEDLNEQDSSGKTLLMCSASSSSDVVLYLLQQGANVHQRDANGDTALMHAISVSTSLSGYNHLIVNLLLKWGADPNQANNKGETPLFLSVKLGSRAKVISLIKFGADVKELISDPARIATMLGVRPNAANLPANLSILEYACHANLDIAKLIYATGVGVPATQGTINPYNQMIVDASRLASLRVKIENATKPLIILRLALKQLQQEPDRFDRLLSIFVGHSMLGMHEIANTFQGQHGKAAFQKFYDTFVPRVTYDPCPDDFSPSQENVGSSSFDERSFKLRMIKLLDLNITAEFDIKANLKMYLRDMLTACNNTNIDVSKTMQEHFYTSFLVISATYNRFRRLNHGFVKLDDDIQQMVAAYQSESVRLGGRNIFLSDLFSRRRRAIEESKNRRVLDHPSH